MSILSFDCQSFKLYIIGDRRQIWSDSDMDTRFFITFIVCALILELIPIRKFVEKTKKYRQMDFSDIDAAVLADRIRSGSYDDDKNRRKYWAKYQWYYNGKKRKVTLYDDSDNFPMQMTLTVNRQTGKFKAPEAERKITNMQIGLTAGAFILGYILASLICGYSPLFS